MSQGTLQEKKKMLTSTTMLIALLGMYGSYMF